MVINSGDIKVGGQAVIEGVMMKSKDAWSVAVRDQNGNIKIKKETLRHSPKLLRIPIIRGLVALFEAMTLGIKAIDFSASAAYGQDEEKVSQLTFAFSMVMGIGLGVALFIYLPLYITKLSGGLFPIFADNSFLFNLLDGIIRVIFFVLYVLIISQWSDMKRIFQYHGAEHKVIYAFESGRKLSIEDIMKYSTRHPRCGTSFLFIVMMISILIFSLIPKTWEFYYKFGSRIVLIPVIAGLSYEILKLSAKASNNPIVKLLIQPGLMLQYITTKEPDEKQLEVAMKALEEVISIEVKEKNV
ncbi:metal-dependent enzyme [Candidatus Magnetoovum chiemensis]|nr:metal-dependent enzyme [Candidatus Magnetoovum chiemensis]